MLLYRFLCAGVLGWTVAWVLSRPEAAPILRSIPEMGTLGPIAGAYVGGFTLANRQGWGFIVALANGAWAGVLAIAASGVLHTLVEVVRAVAAGEIRTPGRFLDFIGDTVELLLAHLGQVQLIMFSLAAASCAGLVTELIHVLMVRARIRRQRSNS